MPPRLCVFASSKQACQVSLLDIAFFLSMENVDIQSRQMGMANTESVLLLSSELACRGSAIDKARQNIAENNRQMTQVLVSFVSCLLVCYVPTITLDLYKLAQTAFVLP